ncbi:hypothetical protein NDU88_000890 [Pleurodeles waltl]|uniref:Uncharacterized protein n=1 Tax=Pleurodeles waltl TaxID=8319 RepID=A0AAV7VZH4_PLEWA|nr:hypothetical protein NDU88_000890 [Pleurodeles waltl]
MQSGGRGGVPETLRSPSPPDLPRTEGDSSCRDEVRRTLSLPSWRQPATVTGVVGGGPEWDDSNCSVGRPCWVYLDVEVDQWWRDWLQTIKSPGGRHQGGCYCAYYPSNGIKEGVTTAHRWTGECRCGARTDAMSGSPAHRPGVRAVAALPEISLPANNAPGYYPCEATKGHKDLIELQALTVTNFPSSPHSSGHCLAGGAPHKTPAPSTP